MRPKDARKLRSVEAVDGRLTGLAAELDHLRGEYAAEASLMEEIDKLLDRRLDLSRVDVEEHAFRRHSPAA